MAGYEFGTLARKLPQDPMPEPQAYPSFRRAAKIEDRRDQALSPADQMQMLMQAVEGLPGYPAPPSVPLHPVPDRSPTPLALQADMLDVRRLAESIGSLPSTITASARR